MNAQHYAMAILKAARGKHEDELDRIVERVVSLLQERGHISLLPNILHELEKLYKRNVHETECLVRIAQENEAALHQEEIRETITHLAAQELPVRFEIDDTLIGGYEVRAGGKRVDNTHKRTLLHLYNTLLTNN